MIKYPIDLSTEYYTDERCYIIEIINTPENPDFSIARARVNPGVTTAPHALQGTEEIYQITEGEGVAIIDGIEYDMVKGDCIVIPPDVSQQIRNVGDGDLIFMCTCFPRFEVKNYVSLPA